MTNKPPALPPSASPEPSKPVERVQGAIPPDRGLDRHVDPNSENPSTPSMDIASRAMVRLVCKDDPQRAARALVGCANELEMGYTAVGDRIDSQDWRFYKALLQYGLDLAGLSEIERAHPTPLAFRLLATILINPLPAKPRISYSWNWMPSRNEDL